MSEINEKSESKKPEVTSVNMNHLHMQPQPISESAPQKPAVTPEGEPPIDIVELKKNIKQIIGRNKRVVFVSKDGKNGRNPSEEFRVSNSLIELIERKATGKLHMKFEVKTNVLKKQVGNGIFEEQPHSAFQDFGNQIIAISEKCAKNQMLMYEEK